VVVRCRPRHRLWVHHLGDLQGQVGVRITVRLLRYLVPNSKPTDASEVHFRCLVPEEMPLRVSSCAEEELESRRAVDNYLREQGLLDS
jgi:hypothetical protein